MDDTTEDRLRLIKRIKRLGIRTPPIDVTMNINELGWVYTTYSNRAQRNVQEKFMVREIELRSRELASVVSALRGSPDPERILDSGLAFSVYLFEVEHGIAELMLKGSVFPFRLPSNTIEAIACLNWIDERLRLGKCLPGIVYEPVWLKQYRSYSMRTVFPSLFRGTAAYESPTNDPDGLRERLRMAIEHRFYP